MKPGGGGDTPSYEEMAGFTLEYVVGELEEFADPEFQRIVWPRSEALGTEKAPKDEPYSYFHSAVGSFMEDSDIITEEAWLLAGLNEEQRSAIQAFREQLWEFYVSRGDSLQSADVIADPRWEKIMQAARRALKIVKQ